jgi:hypothetical protein
MTARLTILLFSALLAGTAGAAAGDKTDVVRGLAGRVGPIIGSALAWPIRRDQSTGLCDRAAKHLKHRRASLSVKIAHRT